MKNRIIYLLAVILLLITVFSLASCEESTDPWSEAIYTEDTVLGEGNKTVFVDVIVNENRIRFTIHTDADMLGDALLDNGIVEGEESQYGLYIKRVNGILADYNVNGSYWGFYCGGEYMISGVDTTPISDGEAFELVYEK